MDEIVRGADDVSESAMGRADPLRTFPQRAERDQFRRCCVGFGSDRSCSGLVSTTSITLEKSPYLEATLHGGSLPE